MVRKKGFPQQSKTLETKAEANKWADATEEAMRNNSFEGILKAENTPFEEVIDRYKDEVTPQKKGAGQEYSRIRVIKRTLITLDILDKPIGKITADDLTDYIDFRLEEVSATTVRRELEIISNIFTRARKRFRLKVGNPAMDIEKPQPGKPRNRRCSRIEQKILLKAASKYGKDDMMDILIPLAIETAMRRGEIIKLVWEHIDLEEGTAYLPDTKNGDQRTVVIPPKNNRS